MVANTNPTTGIRYGVINAHSVSCWVLDDIMQNGTDLHYADARQEAEEDAGREWDMMDEDQRDAHGETREEWIDAALEDFNQSYESNDAPYEFDMDGVKGTFFTGSNVLMIFESPHVVKATLCSPCYPNAGDLDNAGDKAGSTWNGGPVDTYDVPADWRYDEEA